MSCRAAIWKSRCYLSLRSEGRQWSDCQPSDLWAFLLRRRAGGEGSKGYGAERDAHGIAKTSRTVLARGIELGSGRARTATERRGSLTRPGDFVKWGRNERAAAFFFDLCSGSRQTPRKSRGCWFFSRNRLCEDTQFSQGFERERAHVFCLHSDFSPCFGKVRAALTMAKKELRRQEAQGISRRRVYDAGDGAQGAVGAGEEGMF